MNGWSKRAGPVQTAERESEALPEPAVRELRAGVGIGSQHRAACVTVTCFIHLPHVSENSDVSPPHCYLHSSQQEVWLAAVLPICSWKPIGLLPCHSALHLSPPEVQAVLGSTMCSLENKMSAGARGVRASGPSCHC